jgi:anti-sigma regulatory factor (Ser/Thr protein kinase)
MLGNGMQLEHNTRAAEFLEPRHAARVTSLETIAGRMRDAPFGLSLDLAATVDAPCAARNAVVQYAADAGAAQAEQEAIRTVVSEAVTNVVRHAYDDDDPSRPLHVYAGAVGSDLTILIADNGRGPRVPSPDPGLGLGWRLIAQLTDRWTIIQRGAGGTMVYMRFRLERGAA